eukprot:scaffold187_cov266-Chaetoceros_neogracile.AAC.24
MIITKLLIAFTNPAITSTSAIVHAEDVVHVHMILPSNGISALFLALFILLSPTILASIHDNINNAYYILCTLDNNRIMKEIQFRTVYCDCGLSF